MSNRTWFITGASRGFGRSFAQAALTAGDRVAATARDTSTLDDLAAQYGDAVVPVELDVTDRDAAFAAVGEARERLGRLDVVVNNAGYGVSGAIEELSEEQARRQIEVNLFGRLGHQAALPIMREQGTGGSCRSRRSAGWPRSRSPASTTRASGRWRASRNRCVRRSRPSGSRC